MPHAQVLYVGEDVRLAVMVSKVLSEDGFQVERARDARSALSLLRTRTQAVVILDWSLRGSVNALKLAQELRACFPATGIIVCTAERWLAERWQALIAACDDYLTKPCKPRELLTRVRTVAARSSHEPKQAGVLAWGPLRVDFVRQSVEIDGREILLQPLQLRLLGYLVRHQGRCVAHCELREQVFRVAQSQRSTSIARQVSVLRGRLGATGSLIVTVPGGYGIGVTRSMGMPRWKFPDPDRAAGYAPVARLQTSPVDARSQ